MEMRRVLKKGGRLIIVFPNDFVFKLARLVTFMLKEAFYDPGHLRQWTPGDMKSYLKQLGFKIATLRNVPFLFWPISLHCVVAANKHIDNKTGNLDTVF
jgi:ubiquinone/menaquinone biosynthesis C-methylase UbiE